jgi:hypothetical protein
MAKINNEEFHTVTGQRHPYHNLKLEMIMYFTFAERYLKKYLYALNE